MNSIVNVFIVLIAVVAANGCQTISDKRKIDYTNTKTLPPLEIPPDLSSVSETGSPPADAPAPGSATYSTFAGDKKSRPTAGAPGAVLPQYSGIRIAREGSRRWLVMSTAPQALWEPLREFVVANGLLIAEEDPTAGVIETEWAENRANVGTGGQKLIAKWMKTFYSTGLRDKYRLRIERGTQAGTTEIYLTHQGMEEVVKEGGGDGGAGSVWRPRATDPELEAEMLQRLVAHLGGEQSAQVAAASSPAPTQSAPQARLVRDGRGPTQLTLQDSVDRAWRRVGLSLDRIGFTVEDRDRSKGIYYVRYIDPDTQKAKGFFSKLFGDDPPPRSQYQVQLKPTGERATEVAVRDKDGSPDASKTGERILSLLYEQLK